METDTDDILNFGTIYSDLAGSEHQILSGVAALSLGNDGMLGERKHRARYLPPDSPHPQTTSSVGTDARNCGPYFFFPAACLANNAFFFCSLALLAWDCFCEDFF